MKARKRVLLLSTDMSGNWPPEGRLVAALSARGHRVRVVSADIHRKDVEAAGGVFECFTLASSPDRSKPREGPVEPDRARMLREVFTNDVWGDELEAALLREPADLVLIDSLFFMALVRATALRVPFVPLVHSLFGMQLGMNQLPGPLLSIINGRRAELGLSGDSDVLGVLEPAAAILAFTYADWDIPPERHLPNLHYVGPLVLPAARPVSSAPWLPTETEPLVLVSFSTGFQDQLPLLQRVIDAIGTLPVRALVTLGRAVQPGQLQLPTNVWTESFLPHQDVLPHTSLVVTHAGHGTVIAAATGGVPMLCLPMGRDQPAVAQAAEKVGIAKVLSPEAREGSLAAAISNALADKALSRAAKVFASQQDAQAGQDLAVRIVEAI